MILSKEVLVRFIGERLQNINPIMTLNGISHALVSAPGTLFSVTQKRDTIALPPAAPSPPAAD
ncbi:hypothetical protein E2C01_040972 [Portunus trituberculatus]|uniref:Uncharacterized protein n=1 Tax=Portunus trituberculatus TaxID=210409 RepID=A0A5B7FIT1_PORTR|nr:hypothetical protein [Portunus trituberculatus]